MTGQIRFCVVHADSGLEVFISVLQDAGREMDMGISGVTSSAVPHPVLALVLSTIP